MVRIVEKQVLLTICTTMNESRLVWLLSSAIWFAVLSPGKLLPCSKKDVADSLSNYLLECSSVQCFLVLERKL